MNTEPRTWPPHSPYLAPVDEEAVDNVDGDIAADGGEEEREEPAERDHGQDLQLVLEQLEQVGQVLDHHALKHSWARRGGGTCVYERGGVGEEGGRERKGRGVDMII